MIYHPDETIDGIMFGWALEAAIRKNPARQERNRIYHESRIAAYAFAKTKSPEYLISVLKWHNPAYIVELLQQDTYFGLCDRFAGTFYKGFQREVNAGEQQT